MFLEVTKDNTLERWFGIAVPSERIFVLYLATAFILSVCVFFYYRFINSENRPEKIDKGLFSYIFDKDVFLHRSARQDYVYFIINSLLYVGIISQLMVSTHFFTAAFLAVLQNIFGVPDDPLFTANLYFTIGYTIVSVLLLDFAIFITHYFQHKIPVLWQFHQVHHSAEVLTPITVYRMHPVDLFFTGLTAICLTSLGIAGYFYLTGEAAEAKSIYGVNIVLFVFYIVGYNLRHSHIWLNYPSWLSYIFISPAQHQIHHSSAEKHFDKNLGFIFSFWDWMFGTLYVPRQYEKLNYGIAGKTPNPFNSVKELYFKPVRNAWKILTRNDEGSGRKAFNVALIIIFFTIIYGFFFHVDRKIQAANYQLPSLHTEELTWTEVRQAMDRGFKTIIIPTGGTEQNGPHMVLGKHNYVVRYTSEKVAQELGKTLVAPVISYVPQGELEPEPTLHLRYPGTVGIPADVYESVLEHAARSYKSQGFKKIIFLGDSFGNQDGQNNVAEALSKKWQSENIKVIHVADYYQNNNQFETLLSQGFSNEDIGYHAGIRDTSEIMYVYPEGFRQNPVLLDAVNDYGYSGKPDKASDEIGKKMIDLKVKSAVKAIREYR